MKISMNIFLILLLCIGLALTVSSFILASDVVNCNIHAQNAVRGLLTMGVALFSISGTMLACQCAVNFDRDGSILSTVFPVFILAIGITTFGLVMTINEHCVKARRFTPILITLSVVTTIVPGGYLGLKIYNKVKNPNATKIESYSPPDSSTAASSASSSSPTSIIGG